MIYTTYFDNLENLPENIIPIAICGKCPENYKGLKYPKLAPKKKFWLEWEQNKDNEFYKKHFKEEVLDNLNVVECLHELYDLLPNKEELLKARCLPWDNSNISIALICFELPEEFCHRHLVADWINEYFHCVIVQEYYKK